MPPIQWGFLATIAILLSLWQAGLFQQELLNPGGWEQFWRFWRASIHPELTAEMVRLTIDASLTTLAYAVCGTVLTILLGMVGGIFASEVWWRSIVPQHKNSQSSPWWLFVRFLLAVPRAIHEMIWGLFFVNLWGLDPLTAVLAIAIPFGAITAKVFSEILDETPRQPLQNLLNSGVAAPVAFAYSLLPQAFLNLLSYSFYRFECALRSAAVLGIIGAGGLGYQIFLSLQSLNYEQLWTFFYALVVLNGAVDFTSAWLRQQLGCASRLDLNLKRSTGEGRRRERRTGEGLLPQKTTPNIQRDSNQESGVRSQNPKSKIQNPKSKISPHLTLTIISILLLPFCFWYVRADYSKLWAPRTGQLLAEVGQASFPPDWSGIMQLPWLSVQTVAMSVLAIALAATIGMALSFPAAHNFFLPGGLLNRGRQSRISTCLSWATLLFARIFLLFCRAIPAPIWALVALFILFPGILPGAIALGIHNLGILGRLKAEVIENLDFRPLEALKTQGAPSSLVFLYGVLPMTLPRFVAYDLYRWEVCMRETVIVGLVGAGGLGRLLTEQLSSFDYRSLVVTLAGFVLLTFGVDWVSAQMRRSLR
jgi:phosphonate transport system permease protein